MAVIPSLVNESVLQSMVQTMQTTPIEGCIVEVGVYKGGSLSWLVSAAQGRPVYGYDTFTGIPYRDSERDSHRVGDFNDTSYELVMGQFPTVALIQGIFPASAVEMPDISFVHVDCDQYEAVRSTILYCMPKMLPNGIMWFDDYKCLDGATQAVEEIFGDRIFTVSGKGVVRF